MTDALTFHPATLQDRDLFVAHAPYAQSIGWENNFLNILAWASLTNPQLCAWRGHLLLRYAWTDGRPAAYSLYPHPDRVAEALLRLEAEAEGRGEPLAVFNVSDLLRQRIKAELPGRYRFAADRDHGDYIYRREALATLAGKRLQPKRNFANRFRRLYPDYQFRPLSPADFPACLELDRVWLDTKNDDGDELMRQTERRAIKVAFDNWDALRVRGGAIWVQGRLVAFTYGAPISDRVFDVCVEKADARYEGAYAIINQSFAASLPAHYELLNREEDLGVEGLRKAKLSYAPHQILDKFTLTRRDG